MDRKKFSVVVFSSLIVLLLCESSVEAQLSSEDGCIGNGSLWVSFKNNGDAIVMQNLSYIFSSPTNFLTIPIISSKSFIPSAPLWLSVENNQLLQVENGRATVFLEAMTTEFGFSGIFPGMIQITLPKSVNSVNVSLFYTLLDAAHSYPFLYVQYRVVFDPIFQMNDFTLKVQVSEVRIREPVSWYSSPYGACSIYVRYPPSVDMRSNNSLTAEWNFKGLTKDKYPIVGEWAVSDFPGTASGGLLPYVALTALILSAVFEIVYYLGVVPTRAHQKENRKRLAISSRLHPMLLALGMSAWAVLEIATRFVTNDFSFSWILPIYYIVFVYWFIMFFFWPFVNLFDHLISRRSKTIAGTTSDRFTLWMRKVPLLAFMVFLFFLFCLILVNSALGAWLKWPIWYNQTYVREPWFVGFAGLSLALTLIILYLVQGKLMKQQEIVKFVVSDCVGKGSTESVEESVLIRKCEDQGVSSRLAKLALESLGKIDGLIFQESGTFHKVRSEIYVPDLSNPQSDRDFIQGKLRQDPKIKDFGQRWGYDIRPSPTVDEALERWKIRAT